MYLLKFLAQAGVAARRKAEVLIRDGQVRVNGAVVTDPAFVVSATDQVVAAGAPVTVEAKRYLLLHKPLGMVSTVADPQGRPTVVGIVDLPERIYPVGRLDVDTSGVLLLTNDGELANRLMHPRYESTKTYRVTVRGHLSAAAVQRLRDGVELEDGPTHPAEVQVLETTTQRSVFDMTIHEGRNRQIRRMGDAVGHPVEALKRTQVASLTIGDLAPGQWRELTTTELAELRAHVGLR